MKIRLFNEEQGFAWVASMAGEPSRSDSAKSLTFRWIVIRVGSNPHPNNPILNSQFSINLNEL
jgi:hypothetical protein